MTTVNETRYPFFGSVIEPIVDFFVRAARRHRAARELRSIGNNEISAIARDVGISELELRSLAKRDAGFPRMLKSLLSAVGIDQQILQEANPTLSRDMQKVCAFCQNTRRCRKELRAGTASEHFHDYCPNSPNLYAAANYRRLPDWPIT